MCNISACAQCFFSRIISKKPNQKEKKEKRKTTKQAFNIQIVTMNYSKKSISLFGIFVYALLVVVLPLSSKFNSNNSRSSSLVYGASSDDTNYGTVIGIDLGTTYSCVAVMKNGKTEILANEQGNRITPSYVAFTQDERLIGDAAKNQAASNPHNTIFDIKRLIGLKYDDKSIQRDLKHLPYKIVNQKGKPVVEVSLNGEDKSTSKTADTKIFTPEEISGMILGKMKQIAEDYLG